MQPPIPTPAELNDARAEIRSTYIDYCTTVSKRTMAMAYESCAYALCMLRRLKPVDVADFGSGYTSYVLRKYATEAEHLVNVISVDDDASWLAKTGAFLDREGLPSDGLLMWDEYLAIDSVHDFAIYDLSGGDMRDMGMTPVAERTKRNGFVLFDDAQHDGHRASMFATGLTIFDAKPYTVDVVQRYALLGMKL